MTKYIFYSLAILCGFTAQAQNNEPYDFKEFKRLPATEVKSQDQTGTCWAFSTTSLIESEVQRMGKGNLNISEMFVVRHIYRDKCANYVRRQGKAQFSEGGLAHDLLNAVKKYGVVPESEYPGRKNPAIPFNHGELAKALKTKCNEIIKAGESGTLAADWMKEIDAILDAEFGTVPVKFTVGGTIFSPTTYREYLGIEPDDYVTITSFTHHPFNESFILEIPDNWSNGASYNLPLNDMMRCLNYAIQQGYTVDWDADVSNKGFSQQNGIAIVPEAEWKNKDAAAQSSAFKFWEPEKQISQTFRQDQFDRQITADDHLMHITGIMNEEHGGIFYMVKNSWGNTSPFQGYVYCSESYLRLNTISITVHKKALPQDVRRLLGLEEGDVFIEHKERSNPPTKNNLDAQKIKSKSSQPYKPVPIDKSKQISPAQKSDN
ncbi:MAG: aminopeptidase [Saprospiraceae bacterium]|nr:aminopeptidase [Saprospiraceae bacterium]